MNNQHKIQDQLKQQQENQNKEQIYPQMNTSIIRKPQQQNQSQQQHNILPKKSKKWPYSFSALVRKLNLPEYKTQFCKHPHGCIQSILVSSVKITVAGYLIKSGMSLVFGLKKLFSKPSHLKNIIISRDSMNFGFFLGSFVALFRGILCLMRRYFPQDKQKYIPLIAGLFAGFFSVMFLEKKSRQTYALFLLARAIDVTYNSLVKKGILPEFKYFYIVLYSCMMAITGYAYGSQPGCMSPEMNKFYLAFTNETVSDQQMRQIWIQRKNNELAKFGIPRQNPLDYMPKLRKFYASQK